MSLSLYSPKQEENIFIRKQAVTWRRSDLITEEQLDDIHHAVTSDLRQTNLFFRILFFIFTLLLTCAMTGLLVWLINDSSDKNGSIVMVLFGVSYYIIAEYIVRKKKFYRHGIEEGLAVMAMILLCVGCGIFLLTGILTDKQTLRVVTVLTAITSLLIYLRFGWLYGAIIGILALCALPFQFSLSAETERLALLGMMCVTFLLGLLADRKAGEDFKKERNALLLTSLLVAIYLTVNLYIFGVIGLLTGDVRIAHFNPASFPPYIYWSSYALTFLIPMTVIYWGLQSRRRFILNAGLLMTLATLTTNKSYLGMTRYAWDPAILGIVLVGLSLGLTRWLNSGADQKRFGFTAGDILKPESSGINLADVAAALTPSAIDAQQPPQANPSGPYLAGGATGGGGTQRNY
jgi:hypothetical protein